MKNPLQRADRNRTVRKTSCLYELYFFDFLLLTVYMGWNLLISATGAHARFSVLGLFLYLLTVPCLIFTAGYEFSVKAQEENDDALRALLLRRLLLCLFLYVIFSALPLKLSAGLSLDELGVRILRGLDVQPAAGIFLSLAVFYALCTALRSQLQKLIFPVAAVLGVLLLAVSMVPVSGGSYLLFDTLAGGDGSMRVFPVL
ncbi:MAG TPA: hypothetical protein DDX51_06570, partial [Clostridiales bacterium]|nr:hypothetical protein [Clostridiales bacterium]